MKIKLFKLLFLLICIKTFSQENIKIDKYLYMDTQEAINQFKNDYDTKIEKYKKESKKFKFDSGHLQGAITNDKYGFVLFLMENYGAKQDKNLLEVLNWSRFVCGVGYKSKESENVCKTSVKYTKPNYYNEKLKIAKIAINNGDLVTEKALNLCVKKNELDLFKFYKNNYKGKISDKLLNSFLVLSSRYGHIDFVNYFLTLGADPNNNSWNGSLAIDEGIQFPEIFFLLIKSKAHYSFENQKKNENSISTFSLAAYWGCSDIVSFFVEKNINPTIKKGRTSPYENAKKNKKTKKQILKMLKKVKK